MEVAIKKIDITPTLPVPLAGFEHRASKAETIYSPLYLKVFRLKHKETNLILLIADVIWWDDAAVLEWKKYALSQYGIQPHQLVFTATHNHSGPQLSDKFNSRLGEIDATYINKVDQIVRHSISRIMQAELTPCYIEKYEGQQEIGIYRRKIVETDCLMLPNSDHSIDKQLTVVMFKSFDHHVLGTLITTACHPTVTDANKVSSEFIGMAMSKIEQQLNHSTTAFLQGFSGDIRPKLIRDGAFFRGSVKDMEQVAEQFVDDIRRTLQSKPTRIEAETFKSCNDQLELEFSEPVDVQDASLKEEWQSAVRDASGLETARITCWRISSQLKFLFINAEMVHSYGLALKHSDDSVLTVGYADGMIGYVANEQQLTEGGYEADGFVPYFHVAGRLTSTSARRLDHFLEKGLKERE